jgi:hypothetical protein
MKTHTTDDGTTLLLFLCAIALSATAAFYAVSGLVAIFAAAVIPIIVMGSMLEVSKLVLASWLYRNWRQTSLLLRSYFCVALTILMLLTSMGIFGYLSKAHLDQAVPTGDVAAKVAILDEKIKTEKDNVEAAKQQLRVLDSQVEQTIGRSDSTQGVERSLQIRRGQQKERSALLAEIGQAQSRISRLNEERAPISAELRKVEAEVGPLKYVAALLYGDNPDQNVLEKAVRFVIIMIVMVFDPLAVLMLIAVNQSTMRRSHGTETNPNPKEEKASVQQTEDEPITVSVYASQIPAFQGTITVPEGSAQVTITPSPSSEDATASEHQLELDFESGGSEPTAVETRGISDSDTNSTEESVAEVSQPIQVNETLPLPPGPLAQVLRGTPEGGTDVKEILERPRTGRPPRLSEGS